MPSPNAKSPAPVAEDTAAEEDDKAKLEDAGAFELGWLTTELMATLDTDTTLDAAMELELGSKLEDSVVLVPVQPTKASAIAPASTRLNIGPP